MADPTRADSTRAGANAETPSLNVAWLNGYLNLITSGVSLEQFLRRISEEFNYIYRVDVIQIFGFDHDGHLVPQTSFGDRERMEVRRLTRDELHPITDCARTEEVLAIADQKEYRLRYPDQDWSNGPALFIPLRLGPLVDGVFAITFEVHQSVNWDAQAQLQEALVSVANLAHLIKIKSPHPIDLTSPGVEGDQSLGLSDRQIVIAKMIAQGLTNRSIARELGFSEATIRYETIKLYERLRVKNRSHAAARIHQLGIG